MLYFHGFSLNNEEILFEDILESNDFSVSGFSYGAIKAFEYTLKSKSRIDKLTLISPAFFQNRDEKFKRLQLLSFKKSKESYIQNFLNSCKYPSNIDLNPFLDVGKYEELQELLNYKWEIEKIESIIKRGIKIDIYLGADDLIIDSSKVCELFNKYATIYYIKKVGHTLR
jgi:hypothetical protein